MVVLEDDVALRPNFCDTLDNVWELLDRLEEEVSVFSCALVECFYGMCHRRTESLRLVVW